MLWKSQVMPLNNLFQDFAIGKAYFQEIGPG